MTGTAGEIIARDDPRKPFKVVFAHGDKLIAELPSRRCARGNRELKASCRSSGRSQAMLKAP